MKLIDILSITMDYTNVDVCVLNGDVIASYDGKNSIPEELNNVSVNNISVENNTLILTLNIDAEQQSNNYFKEDLTMPKMKYCYVNIKNEVVSPFFNTKKEAVSYLDNGGKVNDTWMFSLEYVRVWSE